MEWAKSPDDMACSRAKDYLQVPRIKSFASLSQISGYLNIFLTCSFQTYYRISRYFKAKFFALIR